MKLALFNLNITNHEKKHPISSLLTCRIRHFIMEQLPEKTC
jgi:hypothetical protein